MSINTNNIYYKSKGKIKPENEQLTVYCVMCFCQSMLARTIRVMKSQEFLSKTWICFFGKCRCTRVSKEILKEVLIKYIRHFIVLNDVSALKGYQQ